jgi:hypothetical protein
MLAINEVLQNGPFINDSYISRSNAFNYVTSERLTLQENLQMRATRSKSDG